jgi:DNA-directed RNA polymerase subunit M/transcription elongation factor TFIIS
MEPDLPKLPKGGSSKGMVGTLLGIKKNGKSILTNDQAKELSALKFRDGEYRLSLEDRHFVYEIVWLLKEVGFDKTYNFLSVDWEKVLGSNNIRKRMLFENPLLDRARDKFILDMDIFKTTVQVEAGEKCRKCGSEETISVVAYVRSLDEAPKISVSCLMCSHKWNAQ